MKKIISIFGVMLALLLSYQVSALTKLQASKLPNFPSEYSRYAELNEDYLIFSKHEEVDGGVRQGFYTYNLKTYQVQFLFNTIAVPGSNGNQPGRRDNDWTFHLGVNHIFVIADSQLYATNGTADGSYLIKDFNSERAGFFNTYIDGNDLYLTVGEIGERTMSVWRSDGTTAGTNQISEMYSAPTNAGPRLHFFRNKNYQSNAVFYHYQNQMWKTVDGGPAEFVQIVPFTKTQNVIETDNGTFFCSMERADVAFSDAAGRAVGTLWRFSNTGVLKVKAEGCSGTLFNNGTIIYYTNEQGIWQTNGTTGNNQLIYSHVDDIDLERFYWHWYNNTCLIDGKLYSNAVIGQDFVENRTTRLQILEIAVDGNVREIANQFEFASNRLLLPGDKSTCINNGFVFSLREFGFDEPTSIVPGIYHYNVSNETVKLVSGIGSYLDGFAITGTAQPQKTTKFVADKYMPFFMNLVNYEPIIIAPIIDLLLDEQ